MLSTNGLKSEPPSRNELTRYDTSSTSTSYSPITKAMRAIQLTSHVSVRASPLPPPSHYRIIQTNLTCPPLFLGPLLPPTSYHPTQSNSHANAIPSRYNNGRTQLLRQPPNPRQIPTPTPSPVYSRVRIFGYNPLHSFCVPFPAKIPGRYKNLWRQTRSVCDAYSS